MSIKINYGPLIGGRYGKLVINGFHMEHGIRMASVTCDCGTVKNTIWSGIRMGRTKSCGCLRRTGRHGMSRSPIYAIWEAMITRCNPETRCHKKVESSYRGIFVCERWKKFENFYADMGDRANGMTLDRIDGNKGYSPDNCRWASRKQQQRNLRSNMLVEINGEKRPVTEWAEISGVNAAAIRNRLRRGIPAKEAVFLKRMNWPLANRLRGGMMRDYAPKHFTKRSDALK